MKRVLLLLLGGALLILVMGLAFGEAWMPQQQTALVRPRIFAYRDWQSTSVQVKPEQIIHINAKGRWLYTPDEYHGPEGHARYPSPSFYPIPNVPGGVLIGKIGMQGQPFVVGKSTVVWATEPGTLYLRINDDRLGDNDGWVDVEIEVETPLE
jgi:hypothetical protein